MESISTDGNFIYVLSSLSHTKSNKLKPKRSKFVRLKRTRSGMKLVSEINLYDVLIGLSKSDQTDAITRQFLERSIINKNIDIESHAMRDNVLFLGFKSPSNDENHAVILKIDDVDALFAGGVSHAGIWLNLDLSEPETGVMSHLSDFAFSSEKLYLLSVSSNLPEVTSYLWRYSIADGSLLRLMEFPGVRAEGISVGQDEGVAMIVVDGNAQAPSRFLLADILGGNEIQ